MRGPAQEPAIVDEYWQVQGPVMGITHKVAPPPTPTVGMYCICSICGYVFCPSVVHQSQQVSVRAMVEWGVYSITTAVGVTDRLTEVSHTNIRLCHLSHTPISCQSTVLFRRLTLKLRCSVQKPPFKMMNKLNATILRLVSLKIVS